MSAVPGEPGDSIADISLAKKLIGWEGREELDEAISDASNGIAPNFQGRMTVRLLKWNSLTRRRARQWRHGFHFYRLDALPCAPTM